MHPTRLDRLTHPLPAGRSRRQVILALAAVVAGISGRVGAPERSASASICGLDDSQDVELYDGTLGVTAGFVAAHQGPVGNLQWNPNLFDLYTEPGTVNAARWCSGTLIADDLFLTAGHCFEQNPAAAAAPSPWEVPRINGTSEPIERADIARNMHVDFNYQFDPAGAVRAEKSIPVVELVEDRLGGSDYAIVRLAENPGPEFGQARIAAEDMPLGSTICIIGHPQGRPKRIEAGLIGEYEGPNLFYNDLDTEGGGAGSGLLASPGGSLVGIHTNGGCTAAGGGNNHGVRMSALLSVSPILRELAAP